jgi:hypothetical protein
MSLQDLSTSWGFPKGNLDPSAVDLYDYLIPTGIGSFGGGMFPTPRRLLGWLAYKSAAGRSSTDLVA